jgi:flavin reductase (DIM6/NTAB) family NADH-FMN oxidoreductase RutF
MEIDLATLPPRRAHDLLTSGVIPRPIAWVSSISADEQVNLAPFSFFTGVTWNPPTLCFSPVNRADGTRKDTVLNIEATGQYVINVVSEELASRMVQTAATLPPETDEAHEVGIPLAPSTVVKVPRVEQAKVAFECVLDRIVTVGTGADAGNLILGTVKRMHVSDDVLAPGPVVDWEKLHVLGRLSGTKYCAVHAVFDIDPQADQTG